jgi:hypothetical protein
MGPIGCPEKSVRNYRYSLRNGLEQHSSQQRWEFTDMYTVLQQHDWSLNRYWAA